MSEQHRSGDSGKDSFASIVNGTVSSSYPKYSRGTKDGRIAARSAATAKPSNVSNGAGFPDHVWAIMDRAGNLLLQKHKDYGPLNISRSPGGPLNGLRVRMWDKTARINHLIDSGATPENESLKDSFIDLLNYAAIAIMVLENTWPAE